MSGGLPEAAGARRRPRPIHLVGLAGQVCELRPQRAVGLRDVAFFSPSAHLHDGQPQPLPVMLVSRRDLDALVGDTHPGAFGGDHGTRRWVRPSGRPFRPAEEWHAVWKFPIDMFAVVPDQPGPPAPHRRRPAARVQTITDLPLPVGRYPLVPDPWSTGRGAPSEHPATKWRVLRRGRGRPPVHFISRGPHDRLAAISSMHWFGDFWSTTPEEERAVRRMLARLSRVGVEAFSCHGQHHAIVFRDSPRELADRLDSDERVYRALSADAGDRALQPWCSEYKRTFGSTAPPPPPSSGGLSSSRVGRRDHRIARSAYRMTVP